MKIRRIDLEAVVWGIIVSHTSYIYINSLIISNYSNIRMIFGIIALLFFSLRHIKILFNENKRFNLLLCFFSIATMLSTIHYSGTNGYFYSVILFIISVITPFLYAQFLNYYNLTKVGCKTIFWCLLIYCVASDIMMYVSPMVDVPWYIAEYYLLGNKFQVSYTHLFMIGFYAISYTDYHKISIKVILLAVFTIAVARFTECSTMVVGGVLFIVLYVSWNRLQFLLQKEITVFIVILVACFLLLVNSALLTIPEIQHIIVDVLNEDLSLTGRMDAYIKIVPMLSNHWLLGFGLDKNMSVSFSNLGIANAQNGLIDSVVSFGIVGTSLMLMMLMSAIKLGKNRSHKTFFIIIYILIILSTVETTMNLKFYTVMSFLAFGWDKIVATDDFEPV